VNEKWETLIEEDLDEILEIEILDHARCTKQSAENADRIAKCHSSQQKENQFIARNATENEDDSN